jgi:hypothetical protein
MKIKFHNRILVLPVLVLLWSALVPSVASGQDSFIISETKLINSEAVPAGDKFGYGVATDGSTLVIGAPYDDGDPNDVDRADNQGAAHPFRYTEGNVFPQTKLTENGDAKRDDRFGNSVDISGDALVIGVYRDDIDATDSGSAFVLRSVYDETTETWTITEQVRLETDDPGEAGNEFGYAVAISGDVVVVGAHREDDAGSASGSVYVFRFDGSAWNQEAKLLAGDARGGDKFGSSVAIDGDTIVVGAIKGGEGDSTSGSIYVFEYNNSVWEQETELFGPDIGVGDQFGYSVAIEGDTIIAGAPRHDDGEIDSGAAYVFRRSAGTWDEEAKLIGSDLSAEDRFGNSVSLSGKTAVVGAYKADVLNVVDQNVMVDAGSVYVFRFDGSDWPEMANLTPSSDDFLDDTAEKDEFGYAVAISGDLVVVGAHKDDILDKDDNLQFDAGSAYVFTLTPENQPPVADAGENQEVEEGSLVTLWGSGSDPDYDVLSYAWAQIGGPEVSLDDPNKAEPTFTAPAWSAENKTLTFELVVNDGRADSRPAEVKITVLQSTKPVTEISSVLGSRRRPWGIDKDIYTFHGTQGERVTVTLSAILGGKNNGGNRATLKLKDNIEGIRFYKMDCSRLPNTISATLPATGQYHVLVAGQPRFFRGRRFLGEYRITLEGASGSLEQGAGSSVVPKNSGSSTKPHKRHPIWSWILSRFRR